MLEKKICHQGLCFTKISNTNVNAWELFFITKVLSIL